MVHGSNFIENTAFYDGSAIYNVGGSTLTVDGSDFINNTAEWWGAIFNNFNAIVTANSSTFTGNTANSGGAIRSEGTLNVYGSIFTNNHATVIQGGRLI